MTSRITSCTLAYRHLSSSIKKHPSLETVDASCILQESLPYISEKGKEYEIVVDIGLFPRRNTYKGYEIIRKKLEIDPTFSWQVRNMRKLASEKLAQLVKSPFVHADPDSYLQKTFNNLIVQEPIISKNGKRFECNAWVHSDIIQSSEEQENDKPPFQITDADKLQEVPLEVESNEALLPCFHPWETLPNWLKEHSNTSLLCNKSAWKHPSGSQYEISLWIHSIPEEISKKGILDLVQRKQTAGQPLKDQIKGLKELAAERLSQVLELRKPPICIAAVKAAMIAEGTFPLCTDVHITEHDIFELSAHVSLQPEQEAREVNEALTNSAMHCFSDHCLVNHDGMTLMYRSLEGFTPNNVLEAVRWKAKRVEETKLLLKMADEGDRIAREELGWLHKWEQTTTFHDKPVPSWPPLPILRRIKTPESKD